MGMEVKIEKRSGWVDLLRVVACAMVVLSYCCDGFVAQFGTILSITRL